MNGCMCANEEIRKDTGSSATKSAILCEHLAGKEQRFSRECGQYETAFLYKIIKLFDPFVPNSHFGIYDVVDQQWAGNACPFELLDRPVGPGVVIGHDIEQDICVDKRHSSPRVSAMIASVSSPLPAWPRSRRKRLAGCFPSVRVSRTAPSAAL